MSASTARSVERLRATRHTWLWVSLALSLAVVVAVGVWDVSREAESALRDLERGQSELAALVAEGVAAQLEIVRLSALEALARPGDGGGAIGVPRRYERLRVVADGAASAEVPPGVVVVSVPLPDGRRAEALVRVSQILTRQSDGVGDDATLLWPPGDPRFHSSLGEQFVGAPLRDALLRGRVAARLTRAQAAALHLPQRVAIAGTSWPAPGRSGGGASRSSRAQGLSAIGRRAPDCG